MIKNTLRPVTVVPVNVDDDGTLERALLLQPAGCHGKVVKDTKASCGIGTSVMRTSARIECHHHFAVGNQPRTEEGTANA